MKQKEREEIISLIDARLDWKLPILHQQTEHELIRFDCPNCKQQTVAVRVQPPAMTTNVTNIITYITIPPSPLHTHSKVECLTCHKIFSKDELWNEEKKGC